DGQQAAHALAADPKAREFLQDQFLHCKTILASRDAERLLRKAGITQEEESASGVIVCERVDTAAVEAFIDGIARHRHFEREGWRVV
ncbi:MAG TPA: catalase HPII, partial [Burkholderiaceae bacterium]|nr:catalase HPII [Burkholderiaceae bacterium]